MNQEDKDPNDKTQYAKNRELVKQEMIKRAGGFDTLSCIVCKKKLESVWGFEGGGNQPYAATAFSTPGYHGSTIFDPGDGHYLEINVCDECLREASQQNLVALGEPSSDTRAGKLRYFVPGLEDE